MTRHAFRTMWLAVALGMIGCGPGVVTQANFEKLQPGMTRAQVEAIMGPPHQNYQQGILTWSAGPKKEITVILDDRGILDQKTMEGL